MDNKTEKLKIVFRKNKQTLKLFTYKIRNAIFIEQCRLKIEMLEKEKIRLKMRYEHSVFEIDKAIKSISKEVLKEQELYNVSIKGE